jgi:hypothetical protein
MIGAPPPPRVRLSLAVTGHRVDNAVYAANQARIAAVLRDIFDAIEAVVEAESALLGPSLIAPTRLHAMLADGADHVAAEEALARGWELVAPLPFGRDLNIAINAKPTNAAEARALLAGERACGADTQARAERIRALETAARTFELADQDEAIAALYLAKLDAPNDMRAAETFSVHASERAGLAGEVMIEQSDILIGVWDGASHAFVGGTGHTIAVALEMGAPVLWVDARAPESWRILRTPESLAALRADDGDQAATLAALIREALRPAEGRAASVSGAHAGLKALETEVWRARSDPLWHAYRRVEAVFGGPSPFRSLRQTYESPDAVAAGSGAGLLAALRALPGADPDLARKVEADVLRRFAWADGVSARLADAYRGGMIVNFVFSASAIIAGVAYLPFARPKDSPTFATVELLVLGAILAITWLGQNRRWHTRWFETRRVAEYFRQSPILLALGVARPPGRWPKGAETSWPEWYALYGLREVGLPRIAMTQAYLRATLKALLDPHVTRQRDYHYGKAKRLTAVQRNLDSLSERLFGLAVVSVAGSLLLSEAAALSIVSHAAVHAASGWFTFLDVVLPALGGALAGIRFFGDFERFAAISDVTAEKLNAVHARIDLLLSAPDEALNYGLVAELAHATDDIVVSEIENWQAVFGGKNITVPV